MYSATTDVTIVVTISTAGCRKNSLQWRQQGHRFGIMKHLGFQRTLQWCIMSAMASQITNLTIAHSTHYSGADQRKHQNSASLAFVRGIHRWPVNSPHKRPVTQKMFPFHDLITGSVIMYVLGKNDGFQTLTKHSKTQTYFLWCLLEQRIVIISHWLYCGVLSSSQVTVTHSSLLDKMAAVLAGDIFKCIFLNVIDRVPIHISLQFVPGSPIDNKPHWFW